MASNSESEFIPDELLSGYLDDELTCDERVRVESTLASSARHRQVLAELRALREGLGALPRHNVDASFQERVLNRIANASGSERDAMENGRQVDPISTSAVADHDSLRRNVMALAAIAAGLLIAFISLREAGWFSVAMNDRHRSSRNVEALDKSPQKDEAQTNQNVRIETDAEDRSDEVHEEPASPERRRIDQAPAALAGPLGDDSASLDPMGVLDSMGGGSGKLPMAPATREAKPVSYAPKQFARIVHAVQQDRVDVVVEVRTNDFDSVVAMLPTDAMLPTELSAAEGTETQDLTSSRFVSSETLVENANRQIVASVDAEEIKSIAQKFRESGTLVNMYDSPTILATLTRPEVRNRYIRYYAVPMTEQDASTSSSYLFAEPEPKQYDLFIDLDAESPRGQEEAKIAVSPVQLDDVHIDSIAESKLGIARNDDDNDKRDARNPALRVLFVILAE